MDSLFSVSRRCNGPAWLLVGSRNLSLQIFINATNALHLSTLSTFGPASEAVLVVDPFVSPLPLRAMRLLLRYYSPTSHVPSSRYYAEVKGQSSSGYVRSSTSFLRGISRARHVLRTLSFLVKDSLLVWMRVSCYLRSSSPFSFSILVSSKMQRLNVLSISALRNTAAIFKE